MNENTGQDAPDVSTMGEPRPWRMPDTFLILFILAVMAWAATFVFTPGQFSVAGDPARIVPGSYQPAAGPNPAPILGSEERTGFLDFLFAGLVTGDRYSATVGLMAFIVVLGGVFGMIMRTGAVDAALRKVLPEGRAHSEKLVVTLFVSFSLAGAIFETHGRGDRPHTGPHSCLGEGRIRCDHRRIGLLRRKPDRVRDELDEPVQRRDSAKHFRPSADVGNGIEARSLDDLHTDRSDIHLAICARRAAGHPTADRID